MHFAKRCPLKTDGKTQSESEIVFWKLTQAPKQAFSWNRNREDNGDNIYVKAIYMGEHTRQAAFKWGIEDGVLRVGRVSTLLYYISVLSGRVEHVSTLLYYMSLLSGRLEQVHRQAFSRNSIGRRMTIYARQAASKYLSCEEHMCSLLGLEIQTHKNTQTQKYIDT